MNDQTPRWQIVGSQPVAVLALDVYEAINLAAALDAAMSPHSPLNVLNSGDWLSQIRSRIPSLDSLDSVTAARRGVVMPNRSVESYREGAIAWGSPK